MNVAIIFDPDEPQDRKSAALQVKSLDWALALWSTREEIIKSLDAQKQTEMSETRLGEILEYINGQAEERGLDWNSIS
jgi:hypothetical protein